jgi:hypothetical protein
MLLAIVWQMGHIYFAFFFYATLVFSLANHPLFYLAKLTFNSFVPPSPNRHHYEVPLSVEYWKVGRTNWIALKFCGIQRRTMQKMRLRKCQPKITLTPLLWLRKFSILWENILLWNKLCKEIFIKKRPRTMHVRQKLRNELEVRLQNGKDDL